MPKKPSKSSAASTSVATAVNSAQAEQRVKPRRTEVNATDGDPMTTCVELCQQERWREALIVCRKACSTEGGSADYAIGLAAASSKIEKSVQRKMAISILVATREMLAREYLLDVGE